MVLPETWPSEVAWNNGYSLVDSIRRIRVTGDTYRLSALSLSCRGQDFFDVCNSSLRTNSCCLRYLLPNGSLAHRYTSDVSDPLPSNAPADKFIGLTDLRQTLSCSWQRSSASTRPFTTARISSKVLCSNMCSWQYIWAERDAGC
jgi:hypothetical protein